MGYTRTELVVIVVIVAAAMLLVLTAQSFIPRAVGPKHQRVCQNNLKNLGDILIARRAGMGWTEHSGAAFLLQVAEEIQDEDLMVYICPGEPPNPDDPRPELGSPAFVEMYHDLELPGGIEHRHCSYAGPDWSKLRPRRRDVNYVIGADKCRHGRLHHADGIVVLYDS
ncbi:MAG: hypothetical protein ACYTDY_00835, partial [Planctomycetota bacterium]